MSTSTITTIVANMKRAIRDQKPAIIGGGMFDALELSEVVDFIEAAAAREATEKRLKSGGDLLAEWLDQLLSEVGGTPAYPPHRDTLTQCREHLKAWRDA